MIATSYTITAEVDLPADVGERLVGFEEEITAHRRVDDPRILYLDVDRDELMVPVARRGVLLASAYTGLCTLIFALFARPLALAFSPDAAVVAVAVRLLQVAAVFQIFDGAVMVGRAALRGAGDARYAAVVGVVTAWVSTPPLTWLLGYRLGFGALGGWLGLCLEIIVSALLIWRRLLRRTWVPSAVASREALRRAAAAPPEGGGALLAADGVA